MSMRILYVVSATNMQGFFCQIQKQIQFDGCQAHSCRRLYKTRTDKSTLKFGCRLDTMQLNNFCEKLNK